MSCAYIPSAQASFLAAETATPGDRVQAVRP